MIWTKNSCGSTSNHTAVSHADAGSTTLPKSWKMAGVTVQAGGYNRASKIVVNLRQIFILSQNGPCESSGRKKIWSGTGYHTFSVLAHWKSSLKFFKHLEPILARIKLLDFWCTTGPNDSVVGWVGLDCWRIVGKWLVYGWRITCITDSCSSSILRPRLSDWHFCSANQQKPSLLTIIITVTIMFNHHDYPLLSTCHLWAKIKYQVSTKNHQLTIVDHYSTIISDLLFAK